MIYRYFHISLVLRSLLPCCTNFVSLLNWPKCTSGMLVPNESPQTLELRERPPGVQSELNMVKYCFNLMLPKSVSSPQFFESKLLIQTKTDLSSSDDNQKCPVSSLKKKTINHCFELAFSVFNKIIVFVCFLAIIYFMLYKVVYYWCAIQKKTLFLFWAAIS